MPDGWEYPWFAAWDLAFHMLPMALVDPDFAKDQLLLLTREWYQHPNGQLPAYEWSFSDVNPPVHAWAALRVYKIDRRRERQAGPRLPPPDLPEAAPQLHLVGQPQGHGGPQRLPGRLPRAGQHRRVRPVRAAPGGRPHRPGGRHGVDGLLLARHAGDRAGAGARRLRLRGRRDEVLRALPVHRRRAQRRRHRVDRRCGIRRTSSSTTCSISIPASSSRSRCARWSG